MPAKRNSDLHGKSFSNDVVCKVWSKGRVVQDYNPDDWRYDICGNPIKFSEHGNIKSKYGWEVDHIKPVSKGGFDELPNLQPLQWENNRTKGDIYIHGNVCKIIMHWVSVRSGIREAGSILSRAHFLS